MTGLRLVTVFLVVLAGSCFTGCGGRTAKIKVGFVSNNSAEFWSIAEAGTKKASKDFDVEVFFRKPPTGTVAEQKELIDALIARQVSGLAVSVREPIEQTPYLNDIVEQHRINLITQDNDAPQSQRLCYIGTDNYLAGKEVGKLVKKALPDGGVVAIFVGQIEPLNAQQRRQGVLDELAGSRDAKGPMLGRYKLHGSGETLGPFTDGADPKVAKEKADQVLVQLQNEKNVCMVGLWAYNPPAILAAVEAAGLVGKVQIAGFDEDRSTLAGIRKGAIVGTVVQNPYEFGYQSVKLLAALARGDRSGLPKDGIMHIPHRIVTRENVDAFEKELDQKIEESKK